MGKNESIEKYIEKNSQEELIYKAAQKKGVNISILGFVEKEKPDGKIVQRPVFLLKKGEKEAITIGATTSMTSYVGIKLAVNKILTNKWLSLKGLPVPFQQEIKNAGDLKKILKQCGKIILKPYGSRCGKGVRTDISSLVEAVKAYKYIKKDFNKVIAEEQIIGSDFRVLVVGKKVVAVLKRIPPFVIGDGKKTIAELVTKINASTERLKGITLKQIKIDEQVVNYLRTKNFSLAMVPKKQEKVELTSVANITAGGIGVNVTKEIHPVNKKIAIQAAKSIGLDVAGIDIVAESISVPLSETQGKIIEVNGGPDLRIHYYASRGGSINPAEDIVEMLLKLKK